MNIYTVLPADLEKAKQVARRCEHEWQDAGAPRVAEPDVGRALQIAQAHQIEFKEAKARSRPSVTLLYLRLVRLFVLTRLPGLGKPTVVGSFAAITCGLSMLLSPFLFSSFGSMMAFALISTIVCSCLASSAVFLLWPTEPKRQRFHQLQGEWKERTAIADTRRLAANKAWADYKSIRQRWSVCNRLVMARKKCQDLAAMLASVKYQLIHTNWRSLRGSDFEHFICHIFQMLGYHVHVTKATGDQGVDLVVTGKGRTLAVQAKGYTDAVGNHSVMEVVAGMTFYRCATCAVITNSRFTATARRLADANGCQLIEGRQIPDLIEGNFY